MIMGIGQKVKGSQFEKCTDNTDKKDNTNSNQYDTKNDTQKSKKDSEYRCKNIG